MPPKNSLKLADANTSTGSAIFSKPSETLVALTYVYLNLIDDTDTVSDNPKNKQLISNLVEFKSRRSPYISLLWKTHEEEIEFYAIPVHEFLQHLCTLFPNVAFHYESKIQAYLSNHPTPYYSKTSVKEFYCMDVLLLDSNLDHPYKLDILFPKKVLEPLNLTKIILTLDISIHWSDSPNIPFIWTESGGNSIQHTSDSIMKGLFDNDSNKDFTIVAANGKEIKCHAFILEVHSSALAAMVSPRNGMVEADTRRVVMKDIEDEAIIHFVRYLYGLKLSTSELSCNVALQLFQIAHKYEVEFLEESISLLLMKKSVEWFSPDTVLELYYFVRYLERYSMLQEHSLRIMLRISKHVRSCERYQELSSEEKEALQWKLIDLK